jgi:hypothetical protein
MNSPFKASAAISPTGWYNLAKFSMADDLQAEKVTHWNGLSSDDRETLATDTNDATYLMLALGEEKNYLVRYYAAWNGKATPEVLLKALALEGGENVNVRRAAALNGSATPEVLLKAVEHDDPYVRYYAARNKNATAKVKTKFVLRYYLENGEFPESSLITPAAINALVRDQRVDLERLGDQIESSPFRNNEYIRASIQLEKKRREKQ